MEFIDNRGIFVDISLKFVDNPNIFVDIAPRIKQKRLPNPIGNLLQTLYFNDACSLFM
jgi:hypothetical protein